ncbi:MAG: Hsp70 family protein [Pirellulales bacterium]
MPEQQHNAVGIDLGTTYSAVAHLDDQGRTAMVRNAEGDLLTPSVVLFEPAEVIVGKEAKKLGAVKVDRFAEYVKRDMGSPSYSRPILGEYLPPEVIQACILRKVKADLTEALGPDFKVVITVPAFFDEPRRKATADAGEMAGLDVLDIVNEPTAAALAFGETLGYLTPAGTTREAMTVLVYDLGGGTFDVTLIELKPGDLRTIATDGDVRLGGCDWDQRLADFAAEAFKKAHGIDPRDDPAGRTRLVNDVIDAKHALSARQHTTLFLEHAGRSHELRIEREVFEELSADLLERTAYTTRQLLSAANLQWKDVTRILLVGGSSRMPMVGKMLQRLSGIAPDHTVNPDEAVARGAALYAGYLLAPKAVGQPETKPAFQVTNVNSHSLGIEGIEPGTHRKINAIVIPRNTPLPSKVTEKFVTKAADQTSIVIQVLEGESSLPGECTAIGRTVLRDLPRGLPKGWPIEVTYEYGANGRLNVRSIVPGTNREVTLELERDSTMSGAKIAAWKQVVTARRGFDAFDSMLDDVLGMEDAATAPSQPSMPSPRPPEKTSGSGSVSMPSTPATPRTPAAKGAEPISVKPVPPPDRAPTKPATAVAPAAIEAAMFEALDLAPPPPGSVLAMDGMGGQATHGTPSQYDKGGQATHGTPAKRARLAASVFSQSPDSSEIPMPPRPVPLPASPRPVEKPAASPSKSRTAALLVNVVGHLLASALGLAIGYLVLCWIKPDANFLHIRLPW